MSGTTKQILSNKEIPSTKNVKRYCPKDGSYNNGRRDFHFLST